MPLPIPMPLPPYLQCRPSLLRPSVDIQLLKRCSDEDMTILRDTHFGMTPPDNWEVRVLCAVMMMYIAYDVDLIDSHGSLALSLSFSVANCWWIN